MKCVKCRHWDKLHQYFNDDIYGCCQKIKDASISEERNTIAYVSDCTEGATHTFHTRHDFGCILFIQK